MCVKYRDPPIASNNNNQSFINLDHGDPTMYEAYWKEVGQRCTLTIPGFESLSYFADPRNLCWFLEPKLDLQLRRLHATVGNALTDDRHVVVGTGSSQLILAATYALADPLNHPNPVDVVSPAPYYSSYPEMMDLLRSGVFKWGGDARCFDHEDGPYIEIVTSPNNPDGMMREAVVNGGEGMLVHDLAYYWPHYTPITAPANHDLMLFTVSKCTGHAGSRIGWALVKDESVARKMVKFIEVNTIGVSKEAQLRAATILETVFLSCHKSDSFFQHSRRMLEERWRKLRDVVKNTGIFHLSKYQMQHCNFAKETRETCPAFAWMKCNDGSDCEKLLREHKILTRSGRKFGSHAEYVRISMLGRDDEFDLFLSRLSTIKEAQIN